LTYLKPCIDVPYGDVNGTMGMGGPSGYYSPTFLAQVAWLPDANRTAWDGAARTYTLHPADRSDLGLTAIKLPSQDSSAGDNTFWLQYNPNPLSYVTDTASPPHGGIAITFEPSEEFAAHLITSNGIVGAATSKSYLCDLTASAIASDQIDYSSDPRLQVLGSWTDPRNRFRITLTDANGTSASVRIEPLGLVSVTEPTDLVVTPDDTGAPHLDLTWAVPATAYGANEPSRWRAELLEDASKFCSVPVWEFACHIDSVSRGVSYTPAVFGVNGINASNRATAAGAQVSSGPPAFFARFESTANSIKVTVHVDNGGAPIIGIPTMSIAGRPPCSISADVDVTCEFSGLQRKTLHMFTAKGSNSLGIRETRFTSRTLAGAPDNPVVTGMWDKRDLIATVRAKAVDVNNADFFDVHCFADGQNISVAGVVMKSTSTTHTFRVAGIRGKNATCYGRVLSVGAVKIYTSEFGLLRVSQTGKITSGRLTIKPNIASPKKGTISVSWIAKDTLGKVDRLVVRSNVGRCKSLSRTRCVISGLSSGVTASVVISGRGASGKTAVSSTVVVK
jgi:hypothetical protein